MKKIYVRFLITLLAACSLRNAVHAFSAAGSYLPSWQTIRSSVPSAAYWPGIGAVAASTLVLNPFDIRSRLNIGQDPIRRRVAALIASPYALPYLWPLYDRLKNQFLAEHGYTEKSLEDPNIRAAWEAYTKNYLEEHPIAANRAYWLGMPAALLFGGYLYNRYK